MSGPNTIICSSCKRQASFTKTPPLGWSSKEGIGPVCYNCNGFSAAQRTIISLRSISKIKPLTDKQIQQLKEAEFFIKKISRNYEPHTETVEIASDKKSRLQTFIDHKDDLTEE